MLLSRSGCETTSQRAQVRYFSIIILSSLVSQRQTTQQSREGGDIVGDGGEATTTFVSKTAVQVAGVHVYRSPSLSLSPPSLSPALPLLPFLLLLLPPVFLLIPLLSFFLFFLPGLHPCLSPVSLSLPHFSPSFPTPPPLLSLLPSCPLPLPLLSSSPPDHLKC